MVHATVEDTLIKLLNAETDLLGGARKYERTVARKDTCAGWDDWHL